ncbi:hypothetical protein [Sulfurimonas sp. CS5]|jgi:hypothetical protein|uniref:hypothetical protein n=1 Tax=Sulfurimonas sp. CS5 TaxID=3391145 RepID=UPI0039E8102E
MNEDDLRIAIYEQLGLEVGSLSSESGNDWARAQKEVLQELKEKRLEQDGSPQEINYLVISREDEAYKSILESESLLSQKFKEVITKRNDLSEDDIFNLIATGSKEVIINLVKNQKLTSLMIDEIISGSVYLTKKNLIENQVLSDTQKILLIELMKRHESAYVDLIAKIQ